MLICISFLLPFCFLANRYMIDYSKAHERYSPVFNQYRISVTKWSGNNDATGKRLTSLSYPNGFRCYLAKIDYKAVSRHPAQECFPSILLFYHHHLGSCLFYPEYFTILSFRPLNIIYDHFIPRFVCQIHIAAGRFVYEARTGWSDYLYRESISWIDPLSIRPSCWYQIGIKIMDQLQRYHLVVRSLLVLFECEKTEKDSKGFFLVLHIIS